ncbi:sigma-B regulation protein RsbU (phosphoserine phosphatase) [Hasllibacter halocynthiae]|uniref:Sigma-B regulation protein RsbU (Phosphoserine phosphatase) n=1 Tax=Hasllibacter halocynthiae TaxID=595589 RepID=A0A2T0X292_9RHOB|nr:fused response regulator/phosphatase [Hasllibacter halocynthiae]PRY93051.1 sigma-B regulation protein RsbU (phosphoserine phosphatase) [Hasllibacter halocynthiae]
MTSASSSPAGPPRADPDGDAPPVVLVVDASRLKRRLVRAHLAPLGCPIEEAGAMEDALRAVRAGRPAIVVSGWRLPGGSGPELCRHIREVAAGTGRYVYSILLTGRADEDATAEGLGAGADDLVSIPFRGADLRARVQAGVRMLAAQDAAAAARARAEAALADLRRALDATERDLDEARRLQRSLVPQRTETHGPALLQAHYESSGKVGGDLLGWFPLARGRLALWAIDVSGHGISSALMAMRVKGWLSGDGQGGSAAFELGRPLRPDRVAARLNQLALREMRTELYFTMFYADLDLSAGTMTFVQAGHPPPLLLRGGGGTFQGSGGLPVGLIEGAEYDAEALTLAQGDQLLIYSDGITECEGPTGQLGEEGLLAIAGGGGQGLLRTITNGLSIHAAGDPPADDVSALLLEWQGAAARKRPARAR